MIMQMLTEFCAY